MGREQKRKQLKKDKHKTNNIEIENTTSVSIVLKIIASVVIILLVLYYILAVFVTKEIDVSENKNNSNETTENSTGDVSNKILATNTFSQAEETYFVYYYDFDDEDEDVSSLINNLTEYSVYRVDTGSSLNKNYVSEDDNGNKNAKSIDELKVINPTLIKVENDTILDYYEGESSIVEFLSK